MEPALRIVVFGEVDQRLLDRVRAAFDLTSTGRLSDEEDVVMGSRIERRPDGSFFDVAFSRDSPGTWTFWVSSEDPRPSDDVLDEYRTRFLAAIKDTGLVVNREWRRPAQ